MWVVVPNSGTIQIIELPLTGVFQSNYSLTDHFIQAGLAWSVL